MLHESSDLKIVENANTSLATKENKKTGQWLPGEGLERDRREGIRKFWTANGYVLVVIVLLIYSCVKPYQTVYLKYMQCTI